MAPGNGARSNPSFFSPHLAHVIVGIWPLSPFRSPLSSIVYQHPIYLVTGPGGVALGASPQVSFAAFQSGTVPSGQSRAPTTLPRAGAASDTEAPRAQTSTGNRKSSVVPSSYFTRTSGGKITLVLRATSR